MNLRNIHVKTKNYFKKYFQNSKFRHVQHSQDRGPENVYILYTNINVFESEYQMYSRARLIISFYKGQCKEKQL